jgi:Ser/Thr protein kinase RdoA (MazF antagonist)
MPELLQFRKYMKINLEIIKSIVDEEVQDFSPLHKGENDSYILKTASGWNLVLKLYRLNRLERIDAKTEIELTQLLLSKGVLTSEHVKFSTGKHIESIGHQTMSLQRLIDGYMLSKPGEDDYRKLGADLRGLHSKTVGINNEIKMPLLSFDSVVQDNWKNVVEADFLNPELLSKINYYKDLVKERFDFTPKSLVHFDAHFGNVIIQEKKMYFIDWEESGFGNPLFDIALCNCHFQRMDKGEKFLYSLLDGYESDFDMKQLSIGTIAKFLDFMGNIPVKQDISVLKEPLKIFERYVGYFEKLAKEGNL